MLMQAEYPVKVQVIRSKNQKPRYYVPLPTGLAAAMNFQASEPVQWILLDRKELHLLRPSAPDPTTQKRAKI